MNQASVWQGPTLAPWLGFKTSLAGGWRESPSPLISAPAQTPKAALLLGRCSLRALPLAMGGLGPLSTLVPCQTACMALGKLLLPCLFMCSPTLPNLLHSSPKAVLRGQCPSGKNQEPPGASPARTGANRGKQTEHLCPVRTASPVNLEWNCKLLLWGSSEGGTPLELNDPFTKAKSNGLDHRLA